PGQNSIHLNQGRSRFQILRHLGVDHRTSYAAEPLDADGDGDIDIAVGNDQAPNQVFLNDGTGRFEAGSLFGDIASVRSLTVADIDGDGDVDILSTCRGMPNQIHLNEGDGRFTTAGSFGSAQDSTIDVAVADWNGDAFPDLILANRDDQRNAILINDGDMKFRTAIEFGDANDQTRAIAASDLNRDGVVDLVAGNIGGPNWIYLGDGQGGFADAIRLGDEENATYALAVADVDNDEDLDVIVGNVGQANAVFFNQEDGRHFTETRFGTASNATYSVDSGDFDGDGFRDIVVGNSAAKNQVFLNRPSVTPSRTKDPKRKPDAKTLTEHATAMGESGANADWRNFRGAQSRGVASGSHTRTTWNADEQAGPPEGILWSMSVPGLGHSSPVISGNRLFIATAISEAGSAPLKVGRGGQPDAAEDNGNQQWVVLCYDRRTGVEMWRQTAAEGKPRATRHAKATHANTCVAVQGDHVIAFFGSEGIHCFDLEGNAKWSQDLGVINISKYGIGWGFASSPVIRNDRIVLVCDDPDHPFVAALNLEDGQGIWRTSRQQVCERSWGTPLIHKSAERTQVVVNGWPWIVSYDLETGEEIWRLRGGGDNPVPTPFEANGWIYITNAHGAESPIFVVRPDAEGDITPTEDTGANDAVVWSTRRGGSYLSTPVVYGDHLYLGNTNGVLRCFDAKSGKPVYEKRLGAGASIISSLVAADGKIYCASENGIVCVVRAGPEFEILARNKMGAPCFATPAIVDGVIYFRTTRQLIAVQ
ncbi:MAG: FG-GAP-like repeat-containing protein, partial [Planctomycetota bacterium]